jgi:hypothetical protein
MQSFEERGGIFDFWHLLGLNTASFGINQLPIHADLQLASS